ncbi:YdeI/OmpD-associated family protein [Adhaeribacter soli]|uniref:DUF1905 domain-containing protein n=1 Tax=Adhaeribacter soli TaxID=2607655 RepID=A0A5N1J5A1_9BACT|nr:YdeI/OmpD-associated family protein [Adhaeribacter soli]KAA9345870.1 DUF1905 domain-containing protein [Adhaeribacter soli]
MNITPDLQEFTAVLEQHGSMNASYITLPFSVSEVYGKKGNVKIRCTFDGYPYRGSLSPIGNNEHILIVIKEVRQAINKTFGDPVMVRIWPDLELRTVQIPEDLEAALQDLPDLKQTFDKMSYTHQKEYVKWIEEAKKPETRQRRLEKTVAMLREK